MDNQCEACRYRNQPKDEAISRNIQNRISRIIGQLGGIKTMIEENRYCGDVLIQLSAIEKALDSVGYEILRNHMATCLAADLKEGKESSIDEAIDLMKRLK